MDLVFVWIVEIDLIFVCGRKWRGVVWGLIHLLFVWVLEIDLFFRAGQKWLGFSGGVKIDPVFVTWFLCAG